MKVTKVRHIETPPHLDDVKWVEFDNGGGMDIGASAWDAIRAYDDTAEELS